MDLGFGFMYGTSNHSTNSAAGTTSIETEASAQMFGFRGGLLMDFGGGSNMDAHAALRLDKAKDIARTTSTPVVNGRGGEYSASGTELEVGARLRLRVSNRFAFVPYAQFTSVSGEPKEDAPVLGGTPTTASYKFSATGLAIGAGGEYKVSSVYLAGGLSFQSLRGKTELSTGGPASTSTTSKATYTSIPTVNFGAEWWLTDWLAVRGGYFRLLGGLKQSTETTVTGGTGSTGEIKDTQPIALLNVGGLGGNWDGTVTLGLGFLWVGWDKRKQGFHDKLANTVVIRNPAKR